MFIKHKEQCLSIIGMQSVKVEEGTIELENYFTQTPGSNTNKYHNHVPCSFAYKVVCIDNRFSKRIVIYRGENAA